MKARGGFTLVELLLAGAILATISFGALIGTLRINQFIGNRSDLMAADGYCWDVAWALFNTDYGELREIVDQASSNGCHACEITGRVLPARLQTTGSGRYEFLSHLQFDGSPPVCYITLSNACDRTGKEDGVSGICIGVNLEWGPADRRSILMPRPGVVGTRVHTVYNHPVEVFRSNLSRTLK